MRNKSQTTSAPASETESPVKNFLMRVLAFLFIGIFAAAAIYLSYQLFMSIKNTRDATTWVTAEGQLLEQKLETIEDFNSIHDVSAPKQYLKARYTYTYNGETYPGERIEFSAFSGDNFSQGRKSRQQDLLLAQPLVVYVNPNNPQESVIDPTLPAELALFITFFLVFPCGFATTSMISFLLWPVKAFRPFTIPVTGIMHGTPALYLLIFHHQSYGVLGALLLVAISCLLFLGLYFFGKKLVTREPAHAA